MKYWMSSNTFQRNRYFLYITVLLTVKMMMMMMNASCKLPILKYYPGIYLGL